MTEDLFADFVERELGASCAEILLHAEAARTDLDLEASVRRRLASLSPEEAILDVCPGCGIHMELSPVRRLLLFERGGVARCRGCAIEKTLAPLPVPEDLGALLYERFSAERYGVEDLRGELRERPTKPTEPRLGRFRVLPRTDGKFVVHEDPLPGERMRFGPVFATELEARWRIWWRVQGEALSGARLGDPLLIQGAPAVLADFVSARHALVLFPATGEAAYVGFRHLKKEEPLVHVLHEGLALCRFDWGAPGEWPAGHAWTPFAEREKATCRACRKNVMEIDR